MDAVRRRKKKNNNNNNNNSVRWAVDCETPCRCSCHENTSYGNKLENSAKFCDKATLTESRPPQTQSKSEVTVVVTSAPPLGIWPVKRTQSLESRDNPFLPGGQLEQEADDLLRHSTVIRDQFFLEGKEVEESIEPDSGNKVTTSPNKSAKVVVEGEIKPAEAKSNEAATTQGKLKENGKVDDGASPDGINADNSKQQTDGDAVRENNKDKKKQKKCCSIM